MHNEYGWQGTSEGASSTVKGLKQLFPSKVAVFSLDEQSSRTRGINPDYVVRIGLEEIEPEDVQMLRESLNLSEVAADAAYSLQRKFGARGWLKSFLSISGGEEMRDLAQDLNVNNRALSTLQNRLRRLMRLPFIDADRGHNSVNRILDYVQNQGMHVVLEFGRYGSNLAAYILVANLLTRRIYARYQQLTDEAAGGDGSQTPRPLVITIEEAHKFLNPGIADQTIFGTIAREMRKYNVTLLVVDQRPSGIDDEIMSQIGTKLTCLLDSDRDVDAVLSGVSGSRKLRSVLSRLESRPAGAGVRTRAADAGGGPDSRVRLNRVIRFVRMARRARAQGAGGARRGRPVLRGATRSRVSQLRAIPTAELYLSVLP